MRKIARSCIYGALGGFCIYTIETFYSMLPYMNIKNYFFEVALIAGVVLGIATTTIVLLHKKPVVMQMLLRCALLFLSYSFLLALNGCIGTRRVLCEIFSSQGSAGSDNVSGMLTLIFLTSVIITSVIIFAVALILRICNRKTKKYYQRRGDSSLL